MEVSETRGEVKFDGLWLRRSDDNKNSSFGARDVENCGGEELDKIGSRPPIINSRS